MRASPTPLDSSPRLRASHRQRLLAVGLALLASSGGFRLGAQPVGPAEPRRQITGRLDSFVEDANLARRNIGDIAFMRDGTVWVAASDGLYRYDGYRWTRFTTEQGLPSDFVRSVHVTREQVLWVGTDKGAGTFTDGKFTLLGTDKTLAGCSVRRIVEDPDGTLWFCSDTWPDATVPGGITSLRDGQWRRYRRAEGLDPHVLNYFRDSTGRRFAMCNTGVFRLKGDRWVRDLSDTPTIWSMAEGPATGVMAVSNNSIFTLKQDQWVRFDILAEGTRQLLNVTREGEIFMGGRDARGLVLSQWTGRAFEQAAPPIETAARVFEVIGEAPDGSIWAGSEGVLVRWERQGAEWRQFRDLPPPRLVDPDGRVWFVGSGFSVVADGERFARVESVSDNVVLDRAGNIWSWSEQQVRRWSHGEVDHFDSALMGLAVIQNCIFDGTGALWVCGRDTGNAPAAAVRHGGEWRRFSIPCDAGNAIASVAANAGSGIWVLLSNRSPNITLVHVSDRGSEFRSIEYGGARYGTPGLLADASGTLWIYGFAGALVSATPLAGGWSRLPGMESNRLLAATVVADRPWFVIDGMAGGQSGFGVYQGKAWQLEHSDITGFMTAEADGTVHVGIPGAVAIAHQGRTEDITRLVVPRQGEVQSLVRAGRDIWVGLHDNSERTSVWRYRADGVPPSTSLKLSPGPIPAGGLLRMDVVGIERWRPHHSDRVFRFSWRIDDGPWSPFGAIPPEGIPLGGIEPGGHRVSVRAQDEGLDVDPRPAVAEFTIAPVPLQDRAWFPPMVLAIIGVIGALALLAAERARKFSRANATLRVAQTDLKRAHDSLERRVEERTAQLRAQTDARQRAEAIISERNRLGSELHDSLEQGLASVAMQLEAAQMFARQPEVTARHLEDASSLLRQAQTEVRRAVNDLHAEVLDDHDLAEALRRHVARLDATNGAKLLFEHSGDRRRLPTEHEHNLFRIAQEAIANALKHSGGDCIRVELEFRDNEVRLSVTDNGAGLRIPNPAGPSGHFGLMGMKRRARRLGGELVIESLPEGTKVVVRLPLSVESTRGSAI